MQLYTSTLADSFRVGLRNRADRTADAPGCSVLRGLRSTPEGLVEQEQVEYPITNHTATSNARFIDATVPLLTDYSSSRVLYEVSLASNTVGSDLLSSGSALSAADGTTPTVVPSGNDFHSISKQGQTFATTGTFFLTNSELYTSWAVGTSTLVPASVCLFKGAIVLAVLPSLPNLSTVWDIFKIRGNTHLPDYADRETDLLLVGNTGDQYTDVPFGIEYSVLTGYKSSSLLTMASDMVEKGQLSLIPIPWAGNILAIKALGNRIMVYGNRGIGYAVPTEQGWRTEQLASYGIDNRMAVAGDDNLHVFYCTDGRLRMIRDEYVISNLFYSEYLGTMTNPRILYQNLYGGYFYISDATTTYILSRSVNANGDAVFVLSQGNAVVYSVCSVGETDTIIGTHGTYTTTFEVASHTLSFKRRTVSKIVAVGCFYEGCTDLEMYADYRYYSGDAWASTSSFPVNKEGFTYFPLETLDTRIHITGTLTGDTAIHDAHLKWSELDYRINYGLTPNE